ncbi:MAG: glycosyl hydrolase family 79 C-terminal domain-containing protein [Candidatus Woesearchaeota archaeon]
MQGHRLTSLLLAAGTALVLAALAAFLTVLETGSARADPLVSASVGRAPSGRPHPAGFLGLSLEFNWLHFYTGRNPKRVDPVFVALVRNLAPGDQSPVLRIGGESTDATWWPIRHQPTPQGISFSLTPHWIQVVRALAEATGARMILGVNFAADRPDLAAAEARAYLAGIGRRRIEGLEIGNEPDNYGIFPWYRTDQGRGQWVWARPNTYSLNDFITEFSRFRSALPAVPIAGPAFAELTWLNGIGQFLSAEPRLALATVHRYPLHGCLTDQSQPTYPSAANLLGDQASSGLAQAVAPSVLVAHRHRVPFRLDEMNSASVASCLGRRGVSGTFASALWVLDTLFNLTAVGVDGVNVHTLPTAAYELFTFRYVRHHWEAFVHPEYYGMLMFVQAFPPGARLLPASVSPSGPLKVWVTQDGRRTVRAVLINKDPANSYRVRLQVTGHSGRGKLERLLAPSVDARGGVTLGGRTFGGETRTGVLRAPRTQAVSPRRGTYTITLPPASAALLTL